MRDPNAPAPQDPNSPEAQGSTASTSQQPLPPPLPLSDQALVVESLANRLVGMKVKDLPAVRDQLQDVIDRLTRRDELTQHLTTRMLAGTIHQAAVAETPQNILDIVSSPLLRGGPGAVFSMEERSRIMETVVDSLTAMLRDGRDLVERHVREAVGQLSEATMTRLNARLDEPHQNNATLIFYGDSRDAIHD